MRWLTGFAPQPLTARVVIWAAAAAAILLAYPMPVWLWFVPLLIAVLPAALPRSVAPMLVMLTVALIWLLRDRVPDGPLDTVRLCGLAVTLYYLHAASAMAAVLPMDANFPPGLFRPALRRAGAATALTIAIGIVVISMHAAVGGHRSGSLTWIGELFGGLGIAGATAVFLIYLGKRAPLD